VNKKIIALLLVLMLATAGIFAKGYGSIGVQFAQPIMSQVGIGANWENYLYYSLGPGIEGQWLSENGKIGVFSTVDFYFPMAGSHSTTNLSNFSSVKDTSSRSSYKDAFGISVFVGPSIRLGSSTKGLFTINPGVHYNMLLWKNSVDEKDYLIGLGLNLQYKFFLTDHLFLSLGGDLTWDFLQIQNTNESSSSSVNFSTLSFNNPKIGFGFYAK